MRLSDLARLISEHPPLHTTLSDRDRTRTWESICVEARPLLLAASWHLQPRTVLVVTNNYDRALRWQARLGLAGVPEDQIRLLPSGLSVLFEDAAPETVALSDRIGALKFLIGETPGFVIATPQAALERTLPKDVLADAFIEIAQGDSLSQEELLDRLVRLGYERQEPVRLPGTFSLRGGIVDLFPMGFERPIRLEFWGDEVESLREFDANSQRSIQKIDSLSIAPSRETMLPIDGGEFREMLERSVLVEGSRLSKEASQRLEEHIGADADALEHRQFFDRLDLYRPLIHPESSCAMDLLGEAGELVLDEPLELEATIARQEEEFGMSLAARHERGEILSATVGDYILPPEHFGGAERCLKLTSMNALPAWLPAGSTTDLGCESLSSYHGQPQAMAEALTGWLKSGVFVGIATDQPTRAAAVLAQVEVFPGDHEGTTLGAGAYFIEGNPAGGFIAPRAKIALLTDHELFGVGRLKLPQRKFRDGIPIATVLDLTPGDFIVHIHFGIGVYRGLIKREQNGIEREYLFIEYRQPDKLYVPADQLDRVQKYLAAEDKPPKINRLSGADWQKTVARARGEARDFARELIALYAKRKESRRPACGPDTPWQSEMEATFPWSETVSQHEAIVDTKRDLEGEFPMDRLVCGDVGFGKTEVAIRAAFKVVQENRQVAVLCPTTILSEQHFRTFNERLAAFPTRIDLLNRFRSAAERRETLEGLADGSVDIVIGTHALLSQDVKFKNLGMAVIDEEQKFGVRHKELLMRMRVDVDVLSLSATPIPRTLSMALMHIRQMSVINDPPPGRLPIRTFVRPFATEVIREAILRELARGGQVYYVYNRVQGIQHVAQRLRKLIPTAKIAVGHGQMKEGEIEPVMLGFLSGEVDILVSTSIVESGLDISNANTLIVENADVFGLSQLYQLRGRVGRSDRQAYAYMLYQGNKTMSENAMSRLQALQEFNQLGSGYSLAFRDLQIRGAGEILGAKQSGHMSTVGFELYSQLIDSEVKYLTAVADGEPPHTISDPLEGLEPLPTVDLPVTALIPSSYIEDEGQRLYYYKQIMSARSVEALSEAGRDIEDRYGHVPDPVSNALSITHLRLDCRKLRIDKIAGDDERIVVHLDLEETSAPRLLSLMQDRNSAATLDLDRLAWPYEGDALHACRSLLDHLDRASRQIQEERLAASEITG